MSVVICALIVVIILPYPISWVAVACRFKQFGQYDNIAPRDQQSKLTGLGARAMAAQANAWEALIMYSATTLILFMSGINFASLEKIALVFIGARVAHALCYFFNLAALRSVSFLVGAGCCGYMIYLASNVAS